MRNSSEFTRLAKSRLVHGCGSRKHNGYDIGLCVREKSGL